MLFVIEDAPQAPETRVLRLRFEPTQDEAGNAGDGVKLLINDEIVMFMYKDSGITLYAKALQRVTGLNIDVRSKE